MNVPEWETSIHNYVELTVENQELIKLHDWLLPMLMNGQARGEWGDEMRRNFAQILKEAKIDFKSEYQKLYGLLFDRSIQVSNTNRISAYDELSERFIGFHFRGTCLSIDEFNDLYEFHFEREPADFSIDNLISLCEYIYNMLMGYQATQVSFGWNMPAAPVLINVQFYLQQIGQVIEKKLYADKRR